MATSKSPEGKQPQAAGKRPLSQRLAENLRAERARRKISQGDVATAAGISVSYVSMLEREIRTPPLDTVDALARALKVDPLALLK